MKAFMDKEFLLETETGSRLFHEYAENCPIIDYHNHLPPRDIFQRRRYENLTQLWLEGDHYKWRCMRVCGVPEKYVTGDAPEWEKFQKFAEIMPRLIGSPVYHWAHLELQRYFGIDTPISGKTAKEIWDKTCEMLGGDGFDAVSLLDKMQVKVLCTTDDPADTLEWHIKLRDEGLPFKTLPSFRPDRFLHIDQAAWSTALKHLGEKYGEITDFESLTAALKKSIDFFYEVGCRVTDHGFIRFRYASGDPAPVMEKALRGEVLTDAEIAVYQGALMRFLAGEYESRGLTMQLHLGPIRNNSPKLFTSFGADAGGDSIGSVTDPFMLGAFLGDLEKADNLPKTILYNLNPADSAMLSTMAANFASDGAKVQYGAAWWMLDHVRGISDQLDQLMETGLISGSVGMLTDSRSFTSFTRHEYFRRILCNKLGKLVENGEYPCDMEILGKTVQDICWRNAVNYFGF
ncbi:MAG: glucuronate isomerase [Oscillospiraceae bacterium]|nr:glucuronate isomerase [Oscillospiraceae bacterium]